MNKRQLLAAVVLGAGLASCSNETTSVEPTVCPDPIIEIQGEDTPLTRAEEVMVSQCNDFAFNLLRRSAKDEENVILSPLSITYALGMLNNGAVGETQQEICQVLGYGEKGTDEINDFCKKLLVKGARIDSTTKVHIANTVFVNKGYQLKPYFLEKAAEYYFAQPQTLDFATEEALQTINRWAYNHTEGMIKEVLNKLNPYAVSYLLNAIYFNGTWTRPFFEMATQDEPFAGGKKVPMMHQQNWLTYAENDQYQAVVLPYGNGKFQMTIVLPREGKSVAGILSQLNGESWQQLTDEMKTYTPIDLKLPRFESETDLNLNEVMQQLGMQRAFTIDAEFPNFCEEATFIGLIKQVARIKVNERGTEAAAVTVIGMDVTSIGIDMTEYLPFHANRPFLYVISERTSGAIFFVGQYVKP